MHCTRYEGISHNVIFCAHLFYGGHVGVLQCTVLNMGEKHLYFHYGAMQVAIRPLLA